MTKMIRRTPRSRPSSHRPSPTADDNQTGVTIKMFQGERADHLGQQAAGQFNLEGHSANRPWNAADRSVFRHRCQWYPARGRQDKGTGKENKITIRRTPACPRMRDPTDGEGRRDRRGRRQEKLELVQARNQAETAVHSVTRAWPSTATSSKGEGGIEAAVSDWNHPQGPRTWRDRRRPPP